jgi:hypothetical protein
MPTLPFTLDVNSPEMAITKALAAVGQDLEALETYSQAAEIYVYAAENYTLQEADAKSRPRALTLE